MVLSLLSIYYSPQYTWYTMVYNKTKLSETLIQTGTIKNVVVMLFVPEKSKSDLGENLSSFSSNSENPIFLDAVLEKL